MLGSAGGPRLALPIVGADPFLIVNGDTLTDVDLLRLGEAHAASRRARDDGARPQPRVRTHYGGVLLDDDGARDRLRAARARRRRLVSFHRRADRQRGVFDSVLPGDRRPTRSAASTRR